MAPKCEKLFPFTCFREAADNLQIWGKHNGQEDMVRPVWKLLRHFEKIYMIPFYVYDSAWSPEVTALFESDDSADECNIIDLAIGGVSRTFHVKQEAHQTVPIFEVKRTLLFE